MEVKKSVVGEGAKVPHLTYLGDAQVGAKSNIGAGTITCNYDGFQKHPTNIGRGVFIGSDTTLVAPLRIGDGALVALTVLSAVLAAAPSPALPPDLPVAVYRERRDVMLDALARYFPPEVTWTKPKGGLFLWVTLPMGADAEKLFEAAVREHVAFVPGDCFYAPNGHGDEGRRHMRLNFSAAAPDQIREGIRRLSIAVKEQLAHLEPMHVGK